MTGSKAPDAKGTASGTPRHRKRPPAAGAAPGAGMNFQAAVTGIAAVHLLAGTPIGWLAGVADDTPLAIWAETHGPGDDVRLEIRNSLPVEVQAKKGLARGTALWETLLALATGIDRKTIGFGVLVVAPDASGTIQHDLAKDILKLGGGRRDGLSDIGEDFVRRLEANKLPVVDSCARLRIQVVHALEADRVGIDAALDRLRALCVQPGDSLGAWNALYRAAMGLIEHKGRWDVTHLARLLDSSSIALRVDQSPAGMLQALAAWVTARSQVFALPGLKTPLPLSALLPMQTILRGDVALAADPAGALERYHASGTRAERRRSEAFEAEFTGLFHRHSVVVAGPGLGKSTLVLELARTYAGMGLPVLRVSLKSVAASMRAGVPFEESLLKWGLDAAPVSVSAFAAARFSDLVVLADGLDDCGDQHHAVADALAAFAGSHPSSRIVVTTRPIGYDSPALASWRHYSLNAPDPEKSAANLASLVRSATTTDRLRAAADDVAKREFGRSKAAPAIGSSPQMLGMAASLIVSEGTLPVSRAALYERMIDLLSNGARPSGGESVSQALRQRVMEVLGWIVIRDPIANTTSILNSCATTIGPELGLASLAAADQVEAAVAFWEAGGLVERLHHSGTTLMTFIHKSFTEYAAARYLIGLDPVERGAFLDKALDDPAWNEVLGFAVGMGAGDEIAGRLVARQKIGATGQIQRAVALLTDPDAVITTTYATTLVANAFDAAARGGDEGFEIGMALVGLARHRPDLISPAAAPMLDQDAPVARLVGWATAVTATPTAFDASTLRRAFAALCAEIVVSRGHSMLGGLRLHLARDRELLQEIGLATLRAVADDEVEAFLATALSGDAFQTMGFMSRIETELDRRKLDKVKKPWTDAMASFTLPLSNLGDPLNKAARAALLGVIAAVAADGAARQPVAGAYPYMASLLRLAGFYDVFAGDVRAWTRPYDAAGVNEALRLLVVASGMPADLLAVDAAALSHHLALKPDRSIFLFNLPSVDLPELEWARVAVANPDRRLLLRALEHESEWLVGVAAAALEAAAPELDELERQLDHAGDLELAGLAQIIVRRFPSKAVDALLPVLTVPVRPGAEHVLHSLSRLDLEADERFLDTLTGLLMSDSAAAARAAAALALALAKRQRFADTGLLSRSFAHWHTHEQPYPKSGGVVPPSPRPQLLEALLVLNAIDDRRLVELLDDPRTDIRELTEAQITSQTAILPPLRSLLVDAMLRKAMQPAFAAKLSSTIAFEREQHAALLALLSDGEGRWRLAGMNLLTSPPMSAEQIGTHLRRLKEDPELEISERARRLLKVEARSG